MNFHKLKWNFYNFNNFPTGISPILQHLIFELIYVESDKNVKYFEMGYPSKWQSYFLSPVQVASMHINYLVQVCN